MASFAVHPSIPLAVIFGAVFGVLVTAAIMVTVDDGARALPDASKPASTIRMPRDDVSRVSIVRRAPVDEEGEEKTASNVLRAEIAELRRQLDQREGMTGARLARARPNVDEAFALRVLETSELFPDARALVFANDAMTAEEVWGALDAEVVYADQVMALRIAGPPSSASWDTRNAYRINTLVPGVTRHSRDLFHRLYELRVPPPLIEAFKTRVIEGL